MRQRSNSFSTAQRFLTIFFSLAILTGSLMAVFYYAFQQSEQNVLQVQEAGTLDSQRIALTIDFQNIGSDLQFLSQLSEVQALLENRGQEEEALALNYSMFAKAKQIYSQIRLIDQTGMEIVRVNNDNGEPIIVPLEELQSKAERYYFQDTLALKDGEIYVSPFDLNIEDGQIEHKPMIRFSTPISDKQGNKRGIVALNYKGELLLRRLEQAHTHKVADIMLFITDEFWLHLPVSAEKWMFMYKERESRTLKQIYPAEWTKISSMERGQFQTANGLFSFTTVYPLFINAPSGRRVNNLLVSRTGRIAPRDYNWKLVSHVSPALLREGTRQLFNTLLLAYGLLLTAIAVISRRLARQPDRTGSPSFIAKLSPIYLMSITAVSIFAAEVSIMAFFYGLPELPALFEGFLDAALLVILVTPVLYIFLFQPLTIYITERQRVEESLRESEEQLNNITNSINDAIIMLDGKGKVTYWNKAACNIFGYSYEEIIGRYLHDTIIPPNYREAHREGLEIFSKTGQGSVIGNTVELEGLRKNGQKFPLEMSLSALEIKGSWHAIGAIRDIAERKLVEEKLRASREQLSKIVETIAEGIYIVSPEGRIIFANKTAEKIFGLPRKELYDRTFNDPRWSIHNLDGSDVNKDDYPFEIVKRTGKPVYGLEFATRQQDRNKSIIRINAAPLYDSSGAFQGMVATEEDITERKKTEEAIRTAHRENEQLLAALPSVLISLDKKRRINRWNAAAERIFGIPAENAMGNLFYKCNIEWDWDRIEKMIDTCEETGQSIVLDDVKYIRTDTKDGFFGLTINPHHNESQSVAGFLLLGADITEKKVMESELTQAQKLESIGSLAAGIAHEINTPTQFVGDNIHFLEGAFNDIKLLLDRYDQMLDASKRHSVSDDLINEIESTAKEIEMEFLSEEVPKAIKSSLKGVERVATIVRAMKDFSHPGSKEKSLVDINKMIESTITISRNEWKYVSEMEMDFDQSLPMIPCFPSEFNQVILNLITNAAHAIGTIVNDGLQGKGTITVATRKEGDFAVITVSDTGTGIPDSIKNKVFDHFFTTKEVGKGTGQGLSISRSIIVEKHGGTIFLESEEGKGTTFIIRLPLNEKTL